MIFDFGWTLADQPGVGWDGWVKTVERALAVLGSDLGGSAAAGTATDYERAVLAAVETALAGDSPPEIDELWAEISRSHGPYAANARSESIDTFGSTLSTGWRLYGEAIPVLDLMSRRRIKMGLLSDVASPSIHWESLAERLGLTHYIKAMAFSEGLGATKPDPAGIRAVIEKLGSNPRECIYIGDTPHKDVDAAVEAGVTAVWLKRRPEAQLGRYKPDHTVDSLRELLRIL